MPPTHRIRGIDMCDSLCEGLEPRRLFAAGDVDLRFGTNGVAAIDSIAGQWNQVVMLDGGGFVVVGQSFVGVSREKPADVIAARYDRDGKIDATFGVAGLATIDLGGADSAEHVAIRSDNRIVIGGMS